MSRNGTANGRTVRLPFNLDARTETAAFYDITKEIADYVLEHHNDLNRGMAGKRTARYMRDRINGRWLTTHQGAGFDKAGRMIDGQHRFKMVSETQLTTRILIVTGLDPEVRLVTDIGDRRSATDVLQINGRTDANMRVVAVVRQMMNGMSRGASVPEIVDAYDIHHEAARTAMGLFPGQNLKNITTSPVQGVFGRAVYTEDLTKLEEAAGILYFGKSPSKGRPGTKGLILLHNWLSELPARGGNLARTIYGYTESALAAFIENTALTELQTPEEELFVLPEKITKKAKAKLKIVHPMKGLAKTA